MCFEDYEISIERYLIINIILIEKIKIKMFSVPWNIYFTKYEKTTYKPYCSLFTYAFFKA